MKKLLIVLFMAFAIVGLAREWTLDWDGTTGLKSDAVNLPTGYVAKYLVIPDNINSDSLRFEVYGGGGFKALVSGSAIYWQLNDTTDATVIRLDPDVWGQFAGVQLKVLVTAQDSAGIAASTTCKIGASKK